MAIKSELIGLMISVPPTIQAQLGEAISVIADSDFYERWDTLVDVRNHIHHPHHINSQIISGPGLSLYSRQRPGQQRCPASRTFHLQAVAPALPI